MSTTQADQGTITLPATTEDRWETIHRQVAELISMESSLEAEIDRQRKHVHAHPEVATAMGHIRATIHTQRDALASYLADAGLEANPVENRIVALFAGDAQSIADLLRLDFAAFSYAAISYAALCEMSFKLYDPALRELAPRHLEGYVQAARTVNTLTVSMVATELAEVGLECRCVCPMCSIGVCGCVSIGTEVATSVWHEAFVVDEAARGFEIQPPRTGSPLAAAGVQGRDRLLAVDGTAVHSIGDIQTAISEHPFGDLVGLLVQHDSDAPDEIQVKRVGAYQ
jgi:membrane-associated protease RseP (regulator of RpoE activity)